MPMLHHTAAGPPEAPPVVLLHGFLGAASDWAGTVEHLAGAFRCVAVEMPGHGSSVELPEEAYTFEGALEAFAATLDGLGIERARIVGYSMGGRMALAFALRHPERVARLVLASASPGLRTPAERAARRAADEALAQEIERDFGAFLRRWYHQPVFASLARRPELREAMEAARRENRPGEIARALRGLGTGSQPALWDDLARLAMPTYALAGSLDPKFAELADAMAALGPPVMPLVLPGAGHTVHAEQPRLFAALVRAFFADALLEARDRDYVMDVVT